MSRQTTARAVRETQLAPAHPSALLPGESAVYATSAGAAYHGDSLRLMKVMPSGCVDLVVTSPPYALHFKKEYGNVDKDQYVRWFLPFGAEIKRVLKPTGSFVLNSAGSGVSAQAEQVGQQITARDLNRQPTIRVRAGWPLRVLVNKDMILAPYP